MHPTPKYKLLRTEFPRIRDLGPTRKKRFQVDARPHSGRRCFEKVGEARAFADHVATQLRDRGTESFILNTEQTVMAVRAFARLRPHQKSLTDAVDFFISHLERGRRHSPTVAEAIDRYLESRKADVARHELAKRSFKDIQHRANQLRAAIGTMRLAEVDASVLRNFINSHPVGAQTRQGIKERASRFWTWCVQEKLVERSPVAEIKIRVVRGDVQIMTVQQAKQLLKAALDSDEPGVIAWFAIACFAGCRPTEIHRMDFSAINFNTKTVTVLGSTSKVKETRYVPLSDVLQSWLQPIAKNSGPVIGVGFERKWRLVIDAAKLRPWIPDICRHSFGSYWLGLHKNRAELAEIMGNSVDVIKKHYRAPVLESDAQGYFALTPKAIREDS